MTYIESKRFLLCCGDATNPSTHGGLSYRLLSSGLKSNLFSGGIKLNPERLKFQKYIWNIYTLIQTGKAGGFQYSKFFCQSLLKQARLNSSENLAFLSHYPFLPIYPWPDNWRVDFYIDATTRQIFDFYPETFHISLKRRRAAIELETNSYKHAKTIICRSEWAANSLISDYKIEQSKVFVVPGGANIDPNSISDNTRYFVPPPPTSSYPLKLGFLGTDWERKGGPFLLRVADNLISRGVPTVVRAIGPNSDSLPNHPALQSLGFIDKKRNIVQFIDELRSWHFGTLFSNAEAFGISNRECLILGIPVLTHAVGGIPSTLPDQGYGFLFNGHPSPDEVVDSIISCTHPYDNYITMRRSLSKRWNEFTWDTAVERIKAILHK